MSTHAALDRPAADEVGIAGVCCPACRSRLLRKSSAHECSRCGRTFPTVGSIPCLIDRNSSLFHRDPPPAPKPSTADRWIPSLSANPVSTRNYRRFADRLTQRYARPRVLVLGGAAVGKGLADALSDSRIEWVETDVFPSPRTLLLCDAHQIPFEDGSFDAVVAQALLEHTLEPHTVVAEIRRVLSPGGYVYAETPFIQQVHAGAHDFTRYTHLGHRRLFRFFEEIESGPACGPGMALAWSWQAFLTAFARGRQSRRTAALAARLTAFWLKYFDYRLVRMPGAYDAASSFYFWGRTAEEPLHDRDLIDSYRGLQ